jgi:RNA polymerase sigma-70 factor (ECF subfamily)
VPSGQEFDTVIDRYGKEIFAYLWRILHGQEDAEDCLQEVFLRAFKAFDRLDRDANIRAWLYKIATNTAISFRKKRSRVESQELLVDFDHLSSDPSPDDRLEWKERLAALLAAIDELPDRQRSALVLRKYQALSYPEISEILGCSQEAARANVYQAMKKLRAKYPERTIPKEQI